MQVLVTGGSGRIGQALIGELLGHGHSVVSADRRPPAAEARNHRFVEIDLADVGQVTGAMVGCDAVVHLGAIPTAYGHADEVVFSHNVTATFAVLQAASLLGVGKATIASSLAALGTAYAASPAFPRFAPIDETHPLLPADPYGLSKEVDERTAQMFHRRFGLQVVALRFALVADADTLRSLGRQLTDRPGPGFLDRVLWAYVDVRDAASALRRSVEADGLGFDTVLISAADSLCDHPTEELIREYAPSVEIRSPIAGTDSAVSTAKAARLLGWQPQHSWRD